MTQPLEWQEIPLSSPLTDEEPNYNLGNQVSNSVKISDVIVSYSKLYVIKKKHMRGLDLKRDIGDNIK